MTDCHQCGADASGIGDRYIVVFKKLSGKQWIKDFTILIQTANH